MFREEDTLLAGAKNGNAPTIVSSKSIVVNVIHLIEWNPNIAIKTFLVVYFWHTICILRCDDVHLQIPSVSLSLVTFLHILPPIISITLTGHTILFSVRSLSYGICYRQYRHENWLIRKFHNTTFYVFCYLQILACKMEFVTDLPGDVLRRKVRNVCRFFCFFAKQKEKGRRAQWHLLPNNFGKGCVIKQSCQNQQN